MPPKTPGHLFVIDSDLTKLYCDAVLVPVDIRLTLEKAWHALLKSVGWPMLKRVAQPEGWGSTVHAFRLEQHASQTAASYPEIWLGEVGRSNPPDGHYARVLVEFVRRVSERAKSTPRSAPLRVGVPVVGTGEGGGWEDKGSIFSSIVPALERAALDYGVDVVLVCFGAKLYSAAQRARGTYRDGLKASESAHGSGLDSRLHAVATELAKEARDANLVLFMGAGVSMGAGGLSWQSLLNELAAKAELTAELKDAMKKLDVRDQAQILKSRLGESFGATVQGMVDTPHYALAHGLLASLRAREAVTTNYDKLYETAFQTDRRELAVLPGAPPKRESPCWLLKLHGTVEKPADLVLARSDYLGLPARSGALFGILQAMLLTRHMLFVGYSLSDDSFHRVIHEVSQARMGVAPHTGGKLGTALILFPDPLLTELWAKDLNIVHVSERAPAPETDAAARKADFDAAARQLNILLDEIAFLAADVSAFLLDSTYENMLNDEEKRIAAALMGVVATSSGAGPIAKRVEEVLRQFGYPPDEKP